jgi:hypothetical protein
LPWFWQEVERGLKAVQKKIGSTNWTVEQVKNCILSGKAGLFVHDDGFVILEPDHEPLSFKPFMNVWIAWFKPQKAAAIRRYLVAWLDEQAVRMVGTKDWRFSSPRAGWSVIEGDCDIHMKTWRRKQ